MILVKPKHKIIHKNMYPEELVEMAGRTCYKSENKVTHNSSKKFVRQLIDKGHHSVIEHANMTVKFICDRGVTHELVRHRLAAYSQESTRYCNYSRVVTFVIPPWVYIPPGEYNYLSSEAEIIRPVSTWYRAMLSAERDYKDLLDYGWSPQQARAVLPNSIKTEIVMTANLREWRHVFTLRCAKAAHPQMRELMIPLFEECRTKMPEFFEDITV